MASAPVSPTDALPPVDVVGCCDQAFARHFAVVMASALANSATPSRLRFWLVSAQPLGAVEPQLAAMARQAGAELRFITTSAEVLAGAPVNHRISLAAYLRLLLPSLLPADVRRAIYLDCDLVVSADLCTLAAIPLGPEEFVGAVQNPRFDRWESLGLRPEIGYFNSGVMLLNLDAWRRDALSHQVLAYIAANPAVLKLHDQDALNAVLHGRWRHLDHRWNQQYSFHLVGTRELGISFPAYVRLLRAPYIVHYSGTSKPWFFADDHPFKHLYYRYLERTPMAGWRPQPRERKDWLRKVVRFVVPHRLREPLFGSLPALLRGTPVPSPTD